MKSSRILDGNYLMPWDVKSDDPEINRQNELLFSSDHDLSEENQNTMYSHTISDEDCLHKASRQSDMGNKKLRSTTTAKTVQKQSRRQVLLSNPTIKRWYDNLARGSNITAYQRLYRLDKFCKEHQMTPMQLADLAMRDLSAVTNLLADHITAMEEQGRSGSYIQSFVVVVKSWLENFDIKLVRRLKVSNRNATPTLESEKVPESQEIAEMLSRADLRTGAIESLVAKAGLRPQVLGNHNATDGLTMNDLPDIAIVQGVTQCIRMPARVIVRRNISKARHQYFTFLTPSGVQRLLAYLNDRLAKGDVLNADSPVIAPDIDHSYGRGANDGKRFLTTSQITSLVRKSLRPRFGWRPYVLRAYFDTQLLIAEARGKIAHDFRVFFMGHKGSMEAKYTTNKGILPEMLVNEMSEAFKRCEEFLDLETRHEDPLQKKREEARQMIERAAPEKVQEMIRFLTSANPDSEGGNERGS
ncbi:MAG: hypothetical protein KGI27_08030 [Thaumarchaeota archaeon]|nr:hypothetical protein [Nitrososphaerota archaeon]